MEDQIRQSPVEESINQRQWKPTTNGKVRQSTIDMHRQHTAIASRLTYLLSTASLSISNMADSINNQIITDNKTSYPEIKDRKTIAAIGVDRVGGLTDSRYSVE